MSIASAGASWRMARIRRDGRPGRPECAGLLGMSPCCVVMAIGTLGSACVPCQHTIGAVLRALARRGGVAVLSVMFAPDAADVLVRTVAEAIVLAGRVRSIRGEPVTSTLVGAVACAGLPLISPAVYNGKGLVPIG